MIKDENDVKRLRYQLLKLLPLAARHHLTPQVREAAAILFMELIRDDFSNED